MIALALTFAFASIALAVLLNLYRLLRGPTRCEVLNVAEQRELLSRLGPDPLRRNADPAVAYERIIRSKLPIAATGVGSVAPGPPGAGASPPPLPASFRVADPRANASALARTRSLRPSLSSTARNVQATEEE